jgi:O-antigen ligase
MNDVEERISKNTAERTWANRAAFVLLCSGIVFATIAYGAVHQPILALIYIVTGAVCALWAVDSVLKRRFEASSDPIQFILLAAAVYGVVQIIPFGWAVGAAGVAAVPGTISLDPFATQLNALHFFVLFLFLAAALSVIDSAARIRRVVAVIAVFGFIYAFYSILQAVLSPGRIYGIYEPRFAVPFGSFVNRHNFAAFMELTICLPLGLLFAGAADKDKRLLYLTAVALMGVAILMSGSRGGFVALVSQVIVLVTLTTGSSTRRGALVKVSAAAVLMIAIVAGSYFVGGESSLTRLADSAVSSDVTTERGHIWRITTKVIADNLPFGAGLGAFGVAYTRHDTLSGLERVEQAHNDYLQVLADAGIPGALMGAAFLFFLFRSGLDGARVRNKYRKGVAIGALAGCFGVLVHSLFDFVLHTTAISLMFLTHVALMAASRRSYNDDLEVRSQHERTSHERERGSVHRFGR